MTTFADVRQALADAVATTGLRCLPYPLDDLPVPCAYVDRAEFDPRFVFSQAKASRNLIVQVLLPRDSERAGQIKLDAYCELSGSTSILAAIQDGNNWPDNLVDSASVTSIGDPGVVNVGGVDYLTTVFSVEVIW